MAKSLKKKVEKRVKKGVRAAEKSIKKLKPDDGRKVAKVAGVAAVGVAGVAGIAAAVQHLRKKNGRTTLHVRTEGEEWVIAAEGGDGPIETFRTKEDAVEAAREAATRAAPSDLVIHRLDGSVMTSHSYQPT